MKVYKIWDTTKKEYWDSTPWGRVKDTWLTKGNATRALTFHTSTRPKSYEIHEFDLVLSQVIPQK